MEDKESSCEEEYEYYTDTENEADGEDNGKLTIDAAIYLSLKKISLCRFPIFSNMKITW